MSETYLAPSLKEQGYTGATGTTPYKPADAQKLADLQATYSSPSITGVAKTVASGATVLTINFDGTQNNGEYPDLKNNETATNVYQLYQIQKVLNGENNTFYYPGVGAQTLPSDTLAPNGARADGASPSDWDSTPWRSGDIANGIVYKAYDNLTRRVAAILDADPNATVSLNLSGFSRGGAEAVAFANLIKEQGIPGLPPEKVSIDTMVLFDPVDQTDGKLNVAWPDNVKNSMVLVATDEGRFIMPAMLTGSNAMVFGMPGAHADVGGSYNPQGIASVALGMAQKFLTASGVPLSDIPAHLQPDWSQMYIHNAGLDNYGNTIWSWREAERYYENSRRGDPSVQERFIIGNDAGAVLNGNDLILGGAGDDTLTGNAGNDWLDGGTSADIMAGGTLDDQVIEQAGQGIDLVKASATMTLSANIENLRLTGMAAVSGMERGVKSRSWRDGVRVNGIWEIAA